MNKSGWNVMGPGVVVALAVTLLVAQGNCLPDSRQVPPAERSSAASSAATETVSRAQLMVNWDNLPLRFEKKRRTDRFSR